jgi:apolipoprotein D and lipocalin family protein
MFQAAFFIVAIGSACSSNSSPNDLPDVQAVPHIELERYAGRWYEIASRPNRFQAGCTGTTATYTLNSDGTIKVENRCFEDGLDGDIMEATGTARVVDARSPAKLEVSFFWPFWGDYWVIDLDPNYEFAVVGQPSRRYLWILSRTPQMDDATYQGIVSRLEQSQYPVNDLNKTVHAQ